MLPSNADDDCLRIHHALSADHGQLGNYRSALYHGQHDLLTAYVTGSKEPDHPDTLKTRYNIAEWTGQSGNAAEALKSSQAAPARLDAGPGPGPPRHPEPSVGSIANWTGRSPGTQPRR